MVANILLRRDSASFDSFRFSVGQFELDQISTHFTQEASNLKTLVPLMTGAFVCKATQAGFSSLGVFPTLTRIVSPLFGLAAEVTTFRSAQQILNAASPSETWFTNFTQFAALKSLGHFGKGQNPVLLHTLQSGGMVAAHQLTYALGFTTQAQGTLFDQWLNAETFNWQMRLGMAGLHGMFPEFTLREKTLDIQAKSFKAENTKAIFQEALLRMGGEEEPRRENTPSSLMRRYYDERDAANTPLTSIAVSAPRPLENVTYAPLANVFMNFGTEVRPLRVPIIVDEMPAAYQAALSVSIEKASQAAKAGPVKIRRPVTTSLPSEVEDVPSLLRIYEVTALENIKKDVVFQLGYLAEFHRDSTVNKAAVMALKELASQGDRRAIYHLNDLASSSSVKSNIAAEALAALTELADRSPLARSYLRNLTAKGDSEKDS